jgi:hypothetical protein
MSIIVKLFLNHGEKVQIWGPYGGKSSHLVHRAFIKRLFCVKNTAVIKAA